MATTVPNTFVNDTTADALQVNANFTAHNTAIDGVAAAAGVPTPASKMRGSTIIATAETRNNTVYGLLPTPDQVSGIVLPTNGLIAVWFEAAWQESVASAARAAIFIGATQLKTAQVGQAAPIAQEAVGPGGTPGSYSVLASYPLGLNWTASTSYTTDSLPQVVGIQGASSQGSGLGGPAYIRAAAGTYTVSVQFRATSGTVTVKDRYLYVAAMGF